MSGARYGILARSVEDAFHEKAVRRLPLRRGPISSSGRAVSIRHLPLRRLSQRERRGLRRLCALAARRRRGERAVQDLQRTELLCDLRLEIVQSPRRRHRSQSRQSRPSADHVGRSGPGRLDQAAEKWLAPVAGADQNLEDPPQGGSPEMRRAPRLPLQVHCTPPGQTRRALSATSKLSPDFEFCPIRTILKR